MSVPGTTTPSKPDSLCGQYFCACSKCVDERARFIVFRMTCKSWDCPDCRAEKAKTYQKRIKKMFDGRQLFMLTLTYFHFSSPELMWGNYNKAWNRLRTNLMKQYGRFAYVRVLESHKNTPYPHLHIIVDREFRPTQLGPAAIHAGFGWCLDFSAIRTERARRYVAKYITKQWENDEAWRMRKLYRCRIVSFSSDIRADLPEPGGWSMLMRGDSYDNCRATIQQRIDWDAAKRYTLVRFDDWNSLTIIDYDMQDVPAGFYERTDPWEYPP